MKKEEFVKSNQNYREWLNYKALLDINTKLNKIIKELKPPTKKTQK